MRNNPVQLTLTILAAAGLAVAVVLVAGSKWYEWVVFGVIMLTGFGAAVAVNQRKYPTRKRAYTRSSESADRRFEDDKVD